MLLSIRNSYAKKQLRHVCCNVCNGIVVSIVVNHFSLCVPFLCNESITILTTAPIYLISWCMCSGHSEMCVIFSSHTRCWFKRQKYINYSGCAKNNGTEIRFIRRMDIKNKQNHLHLKSSFFLVLSIWWTFLSSINLKFEFTL